MAIITLTTDYGFRDFYVASAKGVLNSRFPEAAIVDISHEIDLYNIGMGSYVLKNAFKHFPDKTIHVFAVDASLSQRTDYLVMEYENQYFIAPDNGALSLILVDDEPAKLYKTAATGQKSLFAYYSGLIEKIIAADFSGIGTEIDKEGMVQSTELRPQILSEGNAIKGHIVYEDRYGNAITNVSRKLFEDIGQGRAFEMLVSLKKISRINRFYDDFNTADKPLNDYHGQLFSIFNQNDYLQLSIYKGIPGRGGTVKSLLGLTYRDSFVITFKE